MICLVHGYSLTGSGSNLWTRAIVETLCKQGQTIHLVCQEPRAKQHDFVAAAYEYGANGTPEAVFERDVPYEGRCILHRPRLDRLPIYVPPSPGSSYLVHLVGLEDEIIREYIARNEAALRHIVQSHSITALHVNHVVLMATAVHRVSEQEGVPFAVMPHGSAIEYVVRKDKRMQKFASDALRACSRIFLLNDREMRERILKVFPDVPDAASKMSVIRAGTDTQQFRILDRSERASNIDGPFKEAIAETKRGRSDADMRALQNELSDDISQSEFKQLIERSSQYESGPDAELEIRLDSFDWQQRDVLIFVGRFIGHKGVPSLIMTLPALLEQNPDVRLILVGAGPLREVLEALLWALSTNRRKLARSIVEWGGALEGESAKPFEAAHGYLTRLEREGQLDRFFQTAAQHLDSDCVLFTGYLEHNALRHLLPCCDVAIFPSRVAEGSPLVVPEAAACGVFPMGTYFAGMAACLDVFANDLPDDAAAYLKLNPAPEETVQDIIDHVPQALAVHDQYRETLRRSTVKTFDWRNISKKLTGELEAMVQ